MRILATTPEANLARLPIALDLRAINLAEGARAALAIAAIVAAAQWLHAPLLLEAALGALLTCLGDSGGPVRRRLPSLLAFAVIGTGFMVAGGLARASGIWVALPLGCACVFGCTFARVWGQAAMQAGNLLVVVLILALDAPLDLSAALLRGALFGAGCLWATLLTLVIWRVHPFRPVRRAVAEIYRALARLTADLRLLIGADADDAQWDAHARGHRRAVRDGVEAGRTVVQGTLRAHGPSSPRAYQALMRVEAADQLLGVMIALSDLIEADADPAFRAAAAALLDSLHPALLTVAEAIVANDPALALMDTPSRPHSARIESITARLADIAAAAAGHARLMPLAQALIDRLQTAVLLTVNAPGAPEPRIPAQVRRERAWGAIRANLTLQSATLRHAARAAVMVGPALAFTLAASERGGYQHWLTITLILTLQPFYALTWQRALERMGGTVLGGLIAALVGIVCTTPLTIAAAMFPLAILAFTLRAVNFAAFIACLTPLIVLLTEYGRPDTSEVTIAALRAGYTVAGGLLAIAGAILLWPSWEPDRLAREVRDAILAHAGYADADLGAILGELPAVAVDRARRLAGMASNNLETSISRALNEPGKSRHAGLQRAMVVDAALRRMAGRLSMLQLDPHGVDGVPPPALAAWRGWITAALTALAHRQPSPGRPPAGPAPEALIRIARQVELLEGSGG